MPAAKKRVTQTAAGKKKQKKRRLRPLSLHPLDFETAMRALLGVSKKTKS
jgi:hypothetical protein